MQRHIATYDDPYWGARGVVHFDRYTAYHSDQYLQSYDVRSAMEAPAYNIAMHAVVGAPGVLRLSLAFDVSTSTSPRGNPAAYLLEPGSGTTGKSMPGTE